MPEAEPTPETKATGLPPFYRGFLFAISIGGVTLSDWWLRQFWASLVMLLGAGVIAGTVAHVYARHAARRAAAAKAPPAGEADPR